ncbi:5-(carboxyamino)imidazole ribonucleotide synthase [Curvibacter sp. CHRR-16]|uniref:5-(carboxyamino)imidazole ribonucleotide synthase n=1 Tax=Curvibacter sp. CHRR-16 TaxID=2835872 RepID=UPI001BD9B8F8|nr:5-(carboxyamino)imidazole ribonucleotide synthase [Curvibacter sp. CHRR-16]MBT0570036.1 5-(carboxyamino)imidazole ribonucleotide synthase [Curvibacter sp. CHRR-16]
MTLGVMGGGQLGRMFAHAAQQMGFFTAVLDPDNGSPAGRISHHHVHTSYTDPMGLQALVNVSHAITTEFENVPADSLAWLAQHRLVAPQASAVAIAQDRAAEKAHFVQCGVPCAPHAVIETPEQLAAVAGASSAPLGGSAVHAVTSVGANLLPGILKTARMGYDGKGQVRVRNAAELAAAWDQLQRVPCVLEKMLPLASECSVIVARGVDGTMVNLPVQRNLHRDGILAVTEVFEGNVPAELAGRAVNAAKSIAEGLGYVGVLCVEFFVLDPTHPDAQALGGLVVNEMAPRPHNSGHYSMDACDVSQFHLQVRTLAQLPLVQPRLHSPAIMLNLLGDIWPNEGRDGGVPAWDKVLALPGTHLHLYGKLQAKKGRKMGHLNITGASVEQVRSVALQAAAILGIAPF